MRVLHVPFGYWPDPVGGTEVYVKALCRGLAALGVQSVVAAPGEVDARYTHEDVEVWRYGLSPLRDSRHLYGVPDDQVGESFAQILAEIQPAIVHFHAWTRGVSQACADRVRRLGGRIVWSYHTPTVSCQRGTLLHRGVAACDGRVEPRRCASCVLEAHGVTPRLAGVVSMLPHALSAAALALPASKARTALSMRHLMHLRHTAWQASVGAADRVVALSEWTVAVLEQNGVARERIRLSTHGIDTGRPSAAPLASRHARTGALRLVFIGRAGREKGLERLIEALRLAASADVTLDLYASPQSAQDTATAEGAAQQAAGDHRVRWYGPLEHARVGDVMAQADMVVVPSQVLETGPLVVLESFAAGTPVLGSRLGGIGERVRHEVDGLLVDHGDTRAWARAIERLAANRHEVTRLAENVRPPKSIDEAAAEHHAIYQELIP